MFSFRCLTIRCVFWEILVLEVSAWFCGFMFDVGLAFRLEFVVYCVDWSSSKS